jgi:hypothetical protein
MRSTLNIFQAWTQEVEELAIELAKEKGIQLEPEPDTTLEQQPKKKGKRNVKPFVQTEMEI